MVGRDDARQRVHAVLTGACDGRAIVVRGPAGIGKSRVVEDALDRLAPPVWKVRAGPSLRTTPLGAFALAAPDVVIGASDRRGLVQSLADSIERRPPEAIWVDDAHHLDPESATVVLHLVRQATVPVAITLRDGEDLPPAIDQLLVDGIEQLALDPLHEADVDELVTNLLGGHLDGPSLRRVHGRSGGNPLLLRELLRSGLAHGSIRQQGGVWHAAPDATAPVGLEDLVADHALALPPAAARLFRQVALAGHVPVAALDHLATPEAVTDVLESGLVRVLDDADQVRPDHPLYAEVVIGRLDADLRAELLTDLAAAVEALDRPDEEVRAVRWRLEAGAPLAVERSSAMAWTALAAFDVELVIAASEHALAGGNQGASIPLATGLAYSGRNEEAIPVFEAAVASAHGEWPTAFAKLAGTLNRAYLYGWDTWVADAHRAAAEGVTDPMVLDLLRSEEASALAFSAQLEEAAALAGPVVLDPSVDPAVALPYVPGWAAARTAQGRTIEVIDALARLQDTVREAPSRAHAWLYAFRAQAEAVHGHLEEAEAAMVPFEQLSYLAMVEDVSAVLASEMRGLVALWRGQVADAVRWLDEAAALSGTPESRFRRIIPWAHLAQARALAGDIDGAAAAAAESERAAAMFPLGAGYAGEATAWARSAAGDVTGAARDAASAARRAYDAGLVTTAVWCAADALRLAPGPTPAALVREVTHGVDGRWAAAFRAHAGAVLDREGIALVAVADRYEEIGARLHAAEVLDLAASWLQADGRRDGARRARARADEAHAACTGAVRRTLPAAVDDPAIASLSRREREVAVLAASGLANATIAERLGLSVRTTEGHLARAMAKLDVARRTELPARLGDIEHA